MMRLGTATGSLVNHMISKYRQPEPEVGMGCTNLMWTDRRAFTVICIRRDKRTTVTIQQDNATRIDTNDTMSDAQVYTYEPDVDGHTVELTFRNGAWREVGQGPRSTPFIMGYRSEYRDWSF